MQKFLWFIVGLLVIDLGIRNVTGTAIMALINPNYMEEIQ